MNSFTIKYLILIAFFIVTISACSSPQKYLPPSNPPTAKWDPPVITTPYTGNAYPIWFEAAYVEGTEAIDMGDTMHPYRMSIGNLKVESGKIIACDPINMDGNVPFSYDFPKGVFPVELAVLQEMGGQVCLSRILFSSAPVAKWEVAHQPGEAPLAMKDSLHYCYTVDAGMGVFIDQVANAAFSALGTEASIQLFERDAVTDGDFVGEIYAFGDHNLAQFSTGWGDGCYPSYIGFDSTGAICRLLTDFQLVGWWEIEESKQGH